MPDEKELEEIKKLPPSERLKRLKELEERRKKQESEARKIIAESLEELKLDEMLKEIDVPKQGDVDMNKLFEQQAKDIEEQIKDVDLRAKGEGGSDYGKRIQELLPDNTLNEIQGWYARDNVAPKKDEFLQVYEHAREAYETLQQSMKTGPDTQLYATPSEQLIENVVSSMGALRALGYKHKFFDAGHGP